MPIMFTYGATVVNFLHDPQLGDWDDDQVWMSPSIQAASRVDRFTYDKGVAPLFQTLKWRGMYAADVTALIVFLAAVDGISNAFDYTDPTGELWLARIFNAESLQAALVDYNRFDITIELLIISHYYHLTDEDGNYLTDEDGNHLLAAAAV